MTRRAVQCGTHSGYNTHRYRGETPCDPCRAANTAYHREHYRRTRARLVPADNARARIAQDARIHRCTCGTWLLGAMPCGTCARVAEVAA